MADAATARVIAIANKMRREGDTFLVESSDGMRTYRVTPLACTCPWFENTGKQCKHMRAAELLCSPCPSRIPRDPFGGFQS
jgi:SWIM zinc finger